MCSTLFAVVLVSACVLACGGGGDGSNGSFPDDQSNANGGQQSGSSSQGSQQSSGSFAGTSSGSSGSSSTSSGVSASCASATLSAAAEPLHLVFVVDRSGSMCEYAGDGGPRDCSNSKSKWVQASNALKSFLGSPASRGIKASMIVFPYVDNGQCSSSKYETPITSEVTLPDTTTLPPAIDAHKPQNGDTPTMNALQGAADYAQTIVTATGGKEKVVIVMATDGEPLGCSDAGNIGPAAKVASGIASSIPTYVIGVGPDATDLNTLAKAGGTNTAFTASISDPSQTGAQLSDAFNAIRTATVSCNFGIPLPPAGQTLDYTKVNLQVTVKGNQVTAPYSQGCADPTGWQYDDPSKPTQIELCTSECNAVKGDVYSSVSVVLGCATQVSTTK